MMNSKYFDLEFNEKQQQWHHNHGQNEENTNGWVTIIPNCCYTLEEQFNKFIGKKRKWTTLELLEKASEMFEAIGKKEVK
jgi:hypothetical protein